MQRLLNDLKFHNPFFKINSAQIEILRDPVDFYVNLHRGIRNSQKRIVWSSLYIGQGNLESFLIESLSQQQRRYEQLRISILLDYYRGKRTDSTFQSSLDHLNYLKIANLFSHNMQLGLLRHPLLPKPVDLSNEMQWREVFNTHHMKWYIFDDKVLLTGANLQEAYFTNRQDRYMVFHEVPEIADYLDDAQSTLLQHAFKVTDHETLEFDATRSMPYARKKYFNEFNQTWKMFKFMNDIPLEDVEPKNENSQQEVKEQDPKQEQESESELEVDLKLFERNIILEQKIKEKKEQAAEILSKSFNVGDVQNIVNRIDKIVAKKRSYDDGEDVYVGITLHVPYLQTDEDQKLFAAIQPHIQDAELHWATGYMNFDKNYIKFIKQCKNIKLLTASPQANGFFKAGRAKSLIPCIYRSFERQFDQVYEYKRPQWTFHAKGLWAKTQEFDLTVIGSSNYSQRSIKRDNEIQCYLISDCPRLSEELKQEREYLFKDSSIVTQKEIKEDTETPVTWKVSILAAMLKSLL